MGEESPSRRELVKSLWPDKALYGSTLLMLTGFFGALYGLALFAMDVSLGERVPGFIKAYPPALTIGLSLAAGVLGVIALKQRRTVWAAVGCAAGVASLGFFGLGAVLSVIAFAYMVRSWREREHANLETLTLTADKWPDKSLAASIVMLILAVTTIGWGLAMMMALVNFEGLFGGQNLFGLLTTIIGFTCLAAAFTLKMQRAPKFGLVAAVLAALGVGLVIVGPILAAVALVLIVLAWREREFHGMTAPPPAAAAANTSEGGLDVNPGDTR